MPIQAPGYIGEQMLQSAIKAVKVKCDRVEEMAAMLRMALSVVPSFYCVVYRSLDVDQFLVDALNQIA